jgi:O-succinylbenzoic acid--CoA ligase
MSVNSKSSTCSHELESKISETTNGEHKGQNRVVIEWLRRVEADRPLLYAEDGTWTYGQAFEQVRRRSSPRPRLSKPSLTAQSIFDVVAGISSGGMTVVGPDPEISAPAVADLVVFTSGTSGMPKGVRLTRKNLETAAAASAEHLGHGPEDNWLLAMPLHHVGGLSIVVRQIYTGGSITLLPGFDVTSFCSSMHGRVTMVSVVPTMLRRLLNHDPGPYSGLRAVLVGGGVIPDGLLEAASEAGLPVLPTYGMTETFGQVATLRPGARLRRHAHPLPGVDITITEQGRIAVRGDQVSPGYLGDPDRDSDWFVTSDLGRIDEEGALQVLGRADSVIVTGGENVDPERIEIVVQEHAAVAEAVVVGVPDEEWGSAVVCAYVGEVSAEDLAGWVSERLSPAMRPKRWKRVDELPRLSIGKPDRSAVAELF